MLIATLVLPARQHPDFAAAHRAVDAVTAADIEEPEEFSDLDPDSESALHEDLHRQLDELERSFEGREFTWITVRGADVYVTGGLSWGDSPTHAFEIVDRLRAVRGILAAAGFEGET
ncbi:MAG TPA: hypothetical protein VHU86_08680 [Solirubrobacterales bacterium]|nr:hypothetical protein [Solirubrobacterales bacterium]